MVNMDKTNNIGVILSGGKGERTLGDRHEEVSFPKSLYVLPDGYTLLERNVKILRTNGIPYSKQLVALSFYPESARYKYTENPHDASVSAIEQYVNRNLYGVGFSYGAAKATHILEIALSLIGRPPYNIHDNLVGNNVYGTINHISFPLAKNRKKLHKWDSRTIRKYKKFCSGAKYLLAIHGDTLYQQDAIARHISEAENAMKNGAWAFVSLLKSPNAQPTRTYLTDERNWVHKISDIKTSSNERPAIFSFCIGDLMSLWGRLENNYSSDVGNLSEILNDIITKKGIVIAKKSEGLCVDINTLEDYIEASLRVLNYEKWKINH
jgi:hypothetical protein